MPVVSTMEFVRAEDDDDDNLGDDTLASELFSPPLVFVLPTLLDLNDGNFVSGVESVDEQQLTLPDDVKFLLEDTSLSACTLRTRCRFPALLAPTPLLIDLVGIKFDLLASP